MQETIRKNKIIGSRCFSNYFWTFFLSIGGISFLLAGLSSYFKINLLPFANPTELVFIPQGVVMMFYGTLSLSLGLYIAATIFWDIGGGYNEYNKLEWKEFKLETLFERIKTKKLPYKAKELPCSRFSDICFFSEDIRNNLCFANAFEFCDLVSEKRKFSSSILCIYETLFCAFHILVSKTLLLTIKCVSILCSSFIFSCMISDEKDTSTLPRYSFL